MGSGSDRIKANQSKSCRDRRVRRVCRKEVHKARKGFMREVCAEADRRLRAMPGWEPWLKGPGVGIEGDAGFGEW
jgi:hypothetical protein